MKVISLWAKRIRRLFFLFICHFSYSGCMGELCEDFKRYHLSSIAVILAFPFALFSWYLRRLWQVWCIKQLKRNFNCWLAYIFNVSCNTDPLPIHPSPLPSPPPPSSMVNLALDLFCIVLLENYIIYLSQSRWRIFSCMFSMQIPRLKIEHFSIEYRKSVKTNLYKERPRSAKRIQSKIMLRASK